MKLPRNVGSIALIALALGLGAYVLLIDKDKVTGSERASRPKNVFPAFRREDLSRVEIVTDKETLVFERDVADDAGDRDWKMTSPREEKAEPDAVDRLMGALEFATFVRKLDAAPPGTARAHGTLSMGKLTFKFSLGQPAPAPDGASYFSVEGEGDYVVSKEFTDQLLKGSDAYRSKSVVPYLSIDLARLEVSSDAQKYALVRVDDIAFKLEDSGLRASREKLDRVWLSFADMRADSFLPDADDGHPAFVLRMVPKDAKPAAELAVLGACPGLPDDVVVVRRAPSRVVACVPKIVIEGLSTNREDLLDAKLFSAHEDEVEEMSIESIPPGTRVELARKGSGWHLRSPEDRELQGDEVDVANSLVGNIARGMGSQMAKEPGCPPTSRVTMVRVETHTAEVVDVGTCADLRVTAVRAVDGARLFVPQDLARRLVPRLSALKGRAVFTIDPRDVVSLSLHCGTDQELVKNGTSWSLSAPKGYAPDQAGAVDLVDTIVRARADAWVSDHDDPAFGIGTGHCTATLGVKGAPVTLRFGSEGEGGVYARADASPIFVAPRSLRDAVGKILIDRSALGIDPAAAETVTIEQGARKLVLTRSAGHLVVADGGAPPKLADLERALGQLRADEVVHLGPSRPEEGLDVPTLVIAARPKRITFGRTSLRNNQKMVFARLDGVDATFAVAEDRILPLLDAL